MHIMTATLNTATVTKTRKPTLVTRRALTVQQSKVSGKKLCSTTLSKKFKKRVCTVDGDLGVLPVALTKQDQLNSVSSVQSNRNCSVPSVVNLSKEHSSSHVKVETSIIAVEPKGGISPDASFENNRPITPFLDTSTPTDFTSTFIKSNTSNKNVQSPGSLDAFAKKKSPAGHKKQTRSLIVHKNLKTVIEYTQKSGFDLGSQPKSFVTAPVQKIRKGIRAGLSKKMCVPSLHPNIKRNSS